MAKCRWCEAEYSTDEELARHEGNVGYHYKDRLARANALLKDMLVERALMLQTLTEAQEAGTVLQLRVQEYRANAEREHALFLGAMQTILQIRSAVIDSTSIVAQGNADLASKQREALDRVFAYCEGYVPSVLSAFETGLMARSFYDWVRRATERHAEDVPRG